MSQYITCKRVESDCFTNFDCAQLIGVLDTTDLDVCSKCDHFHKNRLSETYKDPHLPKKELSQEYVNNVVKAMLRRHDECANPNCDITDDNACQDCTDFKLKSEYSESNISISSTGGCPLPIGNYKRPEGEELKNILYNPELGISEDCAPENSTAIPIDSLSSIPLEVLIEEIASRFKNGIEIRFPGWSCYNRKT